LARRGIITPIGKKGGMRRLLMSLGDIYNLFMPLARLLASLAGIMHALRPGTDELLCFCMSRLRREELSEDFGLCVCVSGVPLVCVCVVSAVSRTGTFYQVRVGLLFSLVGM